MLAGVGAALSGLALAGLTLADDVAFLAVAGPDAAGYFGRKDFGFWGAPNGYWEMDEEPYTTAEGTSFRWFRSRIVGGRTNHYGRITLRFADYDFKPYSTDGLGWDWPITYDDVAPYYDKAERFIGVCGTREGIRSAPDGEFLPAPAIRAHEHLVVRAGKRLGIPIIPSRMAIITKPLNGRPACHYCGQCGRGCVTASNYSSSQVQIFPALKTGRLNLITNAMVREILTAEPGALTTSGFATLPGPRGVTALYNRFDATRVEPVIVQHVQGGQIVREFIERPGVSGIGIPDPVASRTKELK